MQSLALESCLVAALGNLVLGLAVFLRNPRSRIHQAFGLLSLAIAVWNGGDFAYFLAQSSAPHWCPFWHRLAFVGSMAIPPAAFILVRALTGRGRDWTWVYGWALLGQFALVVALLWTRLFPDRYRPLAAFYQFSNLGLALLILVSRMRTAGPVERLQMKYLVWGGLVASALGVTDYLAVEQPAIPRLGAVAILLYLGLVSAAVGRHGLFAASKILLRWVWLLVVAFGLAALLQALRWFGTTPGILSGSLFPLLLAILAMALYDPLRESLRLYRSRAQKAFEDVSQAIAAVGRRLVLAPDPGRWQEILLGGLRYVPGVEDAVYLPLPREEGAAPRPAPGMRAAVLGGSPGGGAPNEGLGILAALVREAGPQFNLVVPVQDGEKLHGAVAIALPKAHLQLEPEHLDLLSLLGTQAGLVCQGVERLRWLKQREELLALAEMAAGAAHEIRNPLGAIRGAVDLLLEDPGDRAEHFLSIIREEVDRLDRFLGDFLAYGKPGRLDLEPVDLSALAREAVEVLSLRPQAPAVDQNGASPVWIRGDRSRLKQVLLNVLLNAAQAAGAAGRIEVRIEREPGGAVVRVRDSGPGIPPDVLPRLFRPFFTTREGGTGLGLAICARIVDLHGGRITPGNWKGPDGAGGAEILVRLPEEPLERES